MPDIDKLEWRPVNDFLRKNPFQCVEFGSRQPELALEKQVGFQRNADLYGIMFAPALGKPIIDLRPAETTNLKSTLLNA